MINGTAELEVAPRLPALQDFRALKASTLGTLPRTVPFIPDLREWIKGKFDAAVAQGLVFCNGYTVEEVNGECFKFCVFIAHGLSKKTCFWTSDSPERKPTTGLIAPSILRHASSLIPSLTYIVKDIRKSNFPSTGVSVMTLQPKPLSHSPFSNPEPELTVGPIGSAHTLLLNKYCVLPRQLLLITNEFQPQEGELRKEDWRALVDLLVQLASSRTTKATETTPEDLVFF